MNISNLIELTRATVLNEGSISSVSSFALSLKELNKACVFFSNDELEIQLALQKGAFVIISENDVKITDKDVFFLKVDEIKLAVLRILRFISEEKGLNFILCSKMELNLCPAFSLNYLHGDIFLDFQTIMKAKNDSFIYCDDELYLLKLCASYEVLRQATYKMIEQGSVFFTSLLCEGLYFKNLHFPFILAQNFANIASKLIQNKQEVVFKASYLNFFKIFFIDDDFNLCKFGTSNKALIVVFNELDFEFFKEGFKCVSGFKSALKNSLFCDFSYSKIEDLKYLDFRYCLLMQDLDELLECLVQNKTQEALF